MPKNVKFGLLLLGWVVSGVAFAEPLDEQLVRETLAVRHRLAQEFPSDKYLIVGPGRSPAVVIAALQAADPAWAVTMPLTGASVLTEMEGDLDDLMKERIERFVPETLRKGRKVVLLDMVSRGESLEGLVTFFKGHYGEVTAIGLVDGAKPSPNKETTYWDLRESKQLWRAILMQTYTEYPDEAVIWKDLPKNFRRDPQFDKVVQAFREAHCPYSQLK